MQNQNDLAINLMKLLEPDSYKEFEEGYFVNKPEMSGFYFLFKNMRKPKICLILNTSSQKYPSTMSKVNDYVFIVFNIPSPEEYFENLVDKYFPEIVEIIDNVVEKKSTRNLPYGYYQDENGEVKVDLRAAQEVRKIYDMYIDTKSIRHIAKQLNTNFSDIRDILHDSQEYMQMPEKILSFAKIKEVAELMAANVRGGATAKKDVQDEIADVRRRRKEREKARQQN